MPIESDFRQPGFVRTVFTGVVTRAEFNDHVQRVARLPEESRPQLTFVDLSPLLEAQFSSAEVWPYVRELAARANPTGVPRVEVLLASSMHAYGIARMFQSLVGESFRVEVFRDAQAARQRLLELSDGKWAGSIEPTAPPDTPTTPTTPTA